MAGGGGAGQDTRLGGGKEKRKEKKPPPQEPQYANVTGPRMAMSRTDWQAFYNPYNLLLLSL